MSYGRKYYDGGIKDTYYTERSNSATHPFSTSLAGTDYRLTLSATEDTHLGNDGLIVNANNFAWDGGLIAPHEIALAGNTANSTDIGDISNDLADPASVGISFFRYLNHSMMVLPTVADNAVTGVKVLDVTDGFNTATEMTTFGSTLAEGVSMENAYIGTGAKVNGADVDLYLFVNNEMIKFTKGDEYKRGDVTGDGTVDVSDVNAVINIILELKDASYYPGNADLTGEGTVDVSDVNAIINIILNN